MTREHTNHEQLDALGGQPDPATESRAKHQGQPRSLHLHMISDSEGVALDTISQKVRSQYEGVQTIEHLHASVRSRTQLQRALEDVEAAPGIVIYNLSNQELAKELVQSCKRLNTPCVAAPKPDSGKAAKDSRWLQAGILAPLILFLIWAIGTKSLVAYMADAEAETALRFPSTNPAALVNLAETKLEPIIERVSEQGANEQQQEVLPTGSERNDDPPSILTATDAQSLVEIRSLLESALRKDPLNARAFNLLGRVAQLQGDEQRIRQFMQASVRRSLHMAYPAYWMLVRSYEDQNFSAAIRYADILLRAQSGSQREVVPILAKIAEIPDASAQLKQLLADNPPWRSVFFSRVPFRISDARTPLDLFLALENTPTPSTSKDRSRYIEFLVGRGFYDLAYYTWLQFLPADQLNSLGSLFNGDFETATSETPFDWNFSSQAGAIVDVVDHPDQDGHALFMEFGPGRVDFAGVKQLVVLPPGNYQFHGRQKAEIFSKGGLLWQVSCAKTPKTKGVRIGEGPIVEGRELAWRSFSFSFAVPDSDCPAQYVRLASTARSASEQFISGSIWFDDLQISREPIAKPRP